MAGSTFRSKVNYRREIIITQNSIRITFKSSLNDIVSKLIEAKN